jgi:hypothetical protein
MPLKTIISASRRTDLPAFYSNWLLGQFAQGYAEVVNPYNKKKSIVELKPEQVHSVVLWSKDFSPLLKRIGRLNVYELFFMFTINDCALLEPKVPPLEQRFEQAEFIVNNFDKERLLARFDPIVHWQEGGVIQNNLASFPKIIKKFSCLGLRSIKISFMDTSYKKLARRGVDFIELPLEDKQEITTRLADMAREYGITLQFCCNDYLFENNSGNTQYQSISNIENAACIDGAYLARVVGEPASLKKDPSQRKQCHCTISRDIGSYTQRCAHGCKFCYANPC